MMAEERTKVGENGRISGDNEQFYGYRKKLSLYWSDGAAQICAFFLKKKD